MNNLLKLIRNSDFTKLLFNNNNDNTDNNDNNDNNEICMICQENFIDNTETSISSCSANCNIRIHTLCLQQYNASTLAGTRSCIRCQRIPPPLPAPNRNILTRAILIDIFPDLHTLDVLEINFSWYRQYRYIDHDIFYRLDNLRVIILNDLLELPDTIFNGLVNLRKINISFIHNRNPLSENLFNGLINLRELTIEGTNIESRIFNNLTNLKSLELSLILVSNVFYTQPSIFNRLIKLEKIVLNEIDFYERSLPENIFRGLTKLKEIDLYSTSLRTLPENIFRGLIKLTKINLIFLNLLIY